MSIFAYKHRRALIIYTVSALAGLAALGGIYAAAGVRGLNPLVITGDAKGYQLLAQNLLEQHTFSIAASVPYYPESFRTPGYPAVLAALFAVLHNWTAVLVAQVLLVSSAPVLLYLLMRRYHEQAAFWGSILFVLEPVRLFYSASLLSDAFFTCILLGSLLLLERGRTSGSWWHMAAAGALVGIGILVRPIAIFLPLLYGLYILYAGRRLIDLAKAAVVCGVALACIAPWMIRDHTLFGSWNVSSVGNANLALYNAPEFLKFHPDERGQAILDAFNREQSALPRSEALSLTRSSVFTATFFGVIRGHEILYGFFHLIKTAPFFISDGLRDIVRLFGVDVGTMPNLSTALLRGQVGSVFQYAVAGGVGVWLFLGGVTFWIAICLLWVYTLWLAICGRVSSAWLFFAVIILYFSVLTGPVSNARYRLPVEGILLVSAAVGAAHLMGQVNKLL